MTIPQSCAKNKHKMETVSVKCVDNGSSLYHLVMWCESCGAVRIDMEDTHGDLHEGYIMELKLPVCHTA